MKKVKMILTASSFALALVLSFAFKPSASGFSDAFVKNTAGVCTATTCGSGQHSCVISGLQGYLNSGCSITATMP